MEGPCPLGSKVLLDTTVRGTTEGSGRGQSRSCFSSKRSTERDRETSEPLRSEEATQALGGASCLPGNDGVRVPDLVGINKGLVCLQHGPN